MGEHTMLTITDLIDSSGNSLNRVTKELVMKDSVLYPIFPWKMTPLEELPCHNENKGELIQEVLNFVLQKKDKTVGKAGLCRVCRKKRESDPTYDNSHCKLLKFMCG